MGQANSGDLIDVRPLGDSLNSTKTQILLKGEQLEVIRLVLPTGKQIAEHKAKGEITVQCLEGRVAFMSHDNRVELAAGTIIYLKAGVPHSLESLEDATVLVTKTS